MTHDLIPAVKLYFPDPDRQAILADIDACLREGQLAPGRNVEKFEEAFAEYTGSRHAVALNSGGSALEVAMRALDVRGDEVLLPTNTFVATANSILAAGGIPKLVDIDPLTASPTARQIQDAIQPQTKGVIIVHIGGIITPELMEIKRLCDDRGLWLFEDCAHAHGSDLGGIRAGNFGIGGAYSFCATKIITCGEGGMLITNDDSLAASARLLRNYGKPEPWVTCSVQFGMNWRMNELAAIVGVSQLGRLDEIIERRSAIAETYAKLLRGLSDFYAVEPRGRSSWYKYVVLLPSRADRGRFQKRLLDANIRLPGGVYDIPLHRQPVFADTRVNSGLSGADVFSAQHACLPVYPEMTLQDVEYVSEQVSEAWPFL